MVNEVIDVFGQTMLSRNILCPLRTPTDAQYFIVLLNVQLAKKLQSVNADRGTPIVVKDMSHPVRGHISCFYVFMSCKWINCLLELSSKELRYTGYIPSTTNSSNWEKAANAFLFVLPNQTKFTKKSPIFRQNLMIFNTYLRRSIVMF